MQISRWTSLPLGVTAGSSYPFSSLNGACLTEGVVYEAKVTRRDNKKEEFYTGVTVGTFKKNIMVTLMT